MKNILILTFFFWHRLPGAAIAFSHFLSINCNKMKHKLNATCHKIKLNLNVNSKKIDHRVQTYAERFLEKL